VKVKKRKKVSRMHGSHTHGWGGKKKHRGKGHRGGIGKAGSGKRADKKKTRFLKEGEKYFGKSKALRRGTVTKKLEPINLRKISENPQKFIKKGEKELNLKGYKVLGTGEITEKLIIKASAASKSALDKVKKAGGDIIIS